MIASQLKELTLHLTRPPSPSSSSSSSSSSSRIADYIPPRPPLKKKLLSAEVAVGDFHSATADVADMLLAEYR